uniref:Leukocyte immunoglobulin-like receptor subfamily A member 6 n=1 Tax=Equus asinus TaxID=9793 RepID=A0A8C4PUE9_EQUAS
MVSILSTLVCLGLWNPASDFLAGTLPKPTIGAEPGSVIHWGRPVTVWCQGPLRAQEYRLEKEGSLSPWDRQSPRGPRDKARFSTPHMTDIYAGRYRCYYRRSTDWSKPSDPFDLVVTGSYSKPTLSALPSPVVTSGGNVTLQCGSWWGFDGFILTKEGEHKLSWTQNSQQLKGQFQALFLVGPMSPIHSWIFRCYSYYSNKPQVWSEPSEPLELMVSGEAPPPKPSIWADPTPRVTKGSTVTIWCQGSLQAEVYHLYKERVSKPVDTEDPQDSSDQTSFSIESMSSHTAGLYQCAYSTSRNSWSERSDPLPLVVTGAYGAPSLSAHPGSVVASGWKVFFFCSSENTPGTFHLLKEGGADLPRHVESKTYHGRGQGVFLVGPVNTSHGGTYRCYYNPSSYPFVWSHPSNPLHLEVTGSPPSQPSLAFLVHVGDNLTLQCRSEAGFDRFSLTKDEGLTRLQHLHGQHSPDFPLGHVNHTNRGQYRCYSGHNFSYVWLAPSPHVLIKLSLLAQPGPSVSWGENVTLQCRSEIWMDTFDLSKEGSPAPPQHLVLQDTAAPFQANFSFGPVTSDHEGTYRCYGSNSTSPHLLSLPSDPLELRVSGEEHQPCSHGPYDIFGALSSRDLWHRPAQGVLRVSQRM